MGNTIPIKVFAKYAFQKYIFLQDAPSVGCYEKCKILLTTTLIYKYYCGIIKNCGGQFLVRYPQNPRKVNIEPPYNSNDSILYIFGMKFPDLGIFLEDWNSPSST